MSQVYYDDGNGNGEITEDIEKLHHTAYSTLNLWHYLDKDGIPNAITALVICSLIDCSCDH